MYRGWAQTDYKLWLQHVQSMDTNRLLKVATTCTEVEHNNRLPKVAKTFTEDGHRQTT